VSEAAVAAATTVGALVDETARELTA